MPYTNEEILRDKNNNPIPQIWDSTINKFMPYEGKVQLTGQIGLRPVYHFSTTLVGSAGDTYTLFEHTGPIQIRKMEWLCQHEDTLLSIREKKDDGTDVAIRSMTKNGTNSNLDFTPRRIAEGDSIDIFSIQKYNEFFSNDIYIFKLGLRSPMDFPCGLTILALPVSSFGSSVWRSSLLVWGTAYG